MEIFEAACAEWKFEEAQQATDFCGTDARLYIIISYIIITAIVCSAIIECFSQLNGDK